MTMGEIKPRWCYLSTRRCVLLGRVARFAAHAGDVYISVFFLL